MELKQSSFKADSGANGVLSRDRGVELGAPTLTPTSANTLFQTPMCTHQDGWLTELFGLVVNTQNGAITQLHA